MINVVIIARFDRLVSVQNCSVLQLVFVERFLFTMPFYSSYINFFLFLQAVSFDITKYTLKYSVLFYNRV